MRILEFHFNASKQENNRFPDKISRCFSFLPKNIYERRVGGVFIVGEILNLLPQNIRLLEKMALTIKQSYFGLPLKSVDKSFTECLKTANNFLSQELKNDNVSWLGNLHYGIAVIKDRSFSYAKIGDIRAFLIRDGQITSVTNDKDKTAVRQTKSFNDIIYGNLDNFDRLLIMSGGAEKIFRFAPKSGLQKKKNFKNLPAVKGKLPNNQTTLMQLVAQTMQIETKQLKTALSGIESICPQISGSCLAIEISDTFKENESQVFKIEKSSDWFSFKILVFAYGLVKQRLVLVFNLAKQGLTTANRFLKKYSVVIAAFASAKIKLIFCLLMKWIAFIRSGLSDIYHVLLLKFKSKTDDGLMDNLPGQGPAWLKSLGNRLVNQFKNKKFFPIPIDAPSAAKIRDVVHRISIKINKATIRKRRRIQTKANRYLTVSLFAILFLGFVLFRLIDIIDNDNYYSSKIAIEKLITRADRLTNNGDKIEAISILKQALLETENIKANKWPGPNEIQSLVFQIDSQLKNLYNSKNIDQPSVFFKFSTTDFIPQKIVLAGNNIYAYSLLSPKIYPLSVKNRSISKPIVLSSELWQISSATNIYQKAAFFVKPNRLWLVDNNQASPVTIGISTAEEISLNDSYELDSISSFNGNLYFFDKAYSLIIKYPFQSSDFWSSSEVWVKTKNPSLKYSGTGFLSVNGDVWLLDSENIISQYRAGVELNSFRPDIYPLPKKLYKIVSVGGQPYLYLLEPVLKRLIIIDSSGHTIRQYESSAFDNLKDVTVSLNGQTAYLLNSSTIYQIDMDLNH